MPSAIRRTSTHRHAVFAALLLALAIACSLSTSGAGANEGSQFGTIGQYGELTRFGGFDSTWFDEGKYDGGGGESAPAPGDFIDPVGLAVDTQDKSAGGNGTAVYVLDRVSGITTETAPAQGTRWRLQKLVQQTDGTLEVAAVSEFYLPNSGVTSYDFSSTGVAYLAIDDSTKSVYALLYELDGSGTPSVAEIIDWSTEPSAGKLVAASATPDKVSKPVSGYGSPGLLSSSAQIAGANLYDPQGIALDGTGDLAIVAQSADDGATPEGPVVVQQVSESTGALGSSWTSKGLETAANAAANEESFPAEGIFTANDGSIDVVLARSEFGAATADVVNLHENLSEPTILASEAIEPSVELGGVLSWLDIPQPERTSGGAAAVVELSNGLYASNFKKGELFWDGVHNEGIQLVQPESDGLLSNSAPPLSSIFDTLGNAANSSGPCGINNPTRHPAFPMLAAGASGAAWVLTQGQDTASYAGGELSAYTYGRQLIELSPGATSVCVGPSGTFSLGKQGGSPLQSAATPLTVGVDSTVEFSGTSIDYPNEGQENPEASIYAYEWAPTGIAGGYTIVNDTPEEGGAAHPTATATYKYETPGVYPVALKLLGDFGEYAEAGTVVVQSTNPPTAAFTAPTSTQTGQGASFNASGSAPASGAKISDYHWSFGDGQSDDTQSQTDSHTYTSPGTYTVTLTVHDNDERVSAPVAHQITVSSPASTGGNGEGTGTTATTTSTGPPPVAAVDRSATNVSPRASAVAGAVKLVLSCPVTKISCAGTITIQTASAVVAKRPKKAVLTLGSATFTLAPGATRTVTVRLSSKGVALLKKDGTLKVAVIVAARDSFGDPLTRTLTLTLHKPAMKKTGHKR
jgi:PKD repeat protein